MSQLYDRAEIYDLIENEKRTESIRRDWKQFLGEREIHSLLDVSIGTGGMTLPLQELGIVIFGSDLSEAMLSRCSVKAIAKNKPIELKCSDFRDLSCWKDRLFDCVASTGNALAYVSNEDVLMTLERMDAHVRPGGYLCFDSRNWEKIQREKQRFYLYNPFFHNDTKTEKQCNSLKEATILFGGDKKMAMSLMARINAIEKADVIKDIIVMPTFRFHRLQGNLKKYFAIDVKTKRDKWRIILQPLDEDEKEYDPLNIDEIAGIVKIVEIREVSAHYE